MKRLSIGFAALALALGGLVTPVTAPAQDTSSGGPTPPPKQQCGKTKTKWQRKQCDNYNNSAPGDEYFGRDKESYLGVENTFKDMFISAGDTTTDSRVIGKLHNASDALAVWASKYPKDPELARAYFLGVKVYVKVYTEDGQQLAWEYMQTILHHFPNTYFSKTVNQTINGGFTEHWYAEAVACPAPGAVADPTPTPAPPAKGQPAVELLVPACIQAATAEPATPSSSSSPSPSSRPKNAPAAVVKNSPVATKVPGPNPPPP